MASRVRDQLQERMRGQVLAPEDEGYGVARKVWNGAIDRKPALIARCRGTADVIASVRFARERELPASIRGGGHSVAGHAVCDDGLMIDLSPMAGARVDPAGRIVRAQGGCLQGDVDRETQAFGLAVTGGLVSHTGIGGLTLGGGIGWLMRTAGLALDNLRSADVITADGELTVASRAENPDLFWALRGGGGNFGVVTSFEYELHPVGPTVLAGMVIHTMDDARAVLGFVRDYLADAPDEVGLLVTLRLAPALPIIPDELHGKPIVGLVLCHPGPLDQGAKALRPLRAFGSPVLDAVAPKPYVVHQQMFDAAFPHGRSYYWRSTKLRPLTSESIATIISHASEITSPYSTVSIFTLGGAVARVPEADTAYPGRDAAHEIITVAAWEPRDPQPDRHVQWVRRFSAGLDPHAVGAYVNFMADAQQDQIRAAYGVQRYQRLATLKRMYDPTNFFRFNQNIRPA
jgi:FAD/FMN-containing dehydrogenase